MNVIVAERDGLGTPTALALTGQEDMATALVYPGIEVHHRADLALTLQITRGVDLDEEHHLRHISHAILIQFFDKTRAKSCFHPNRHLIQI